MAKKKLTKLLKLPKWAKIGLWIMGVLAGLILVTVIGLKIWVSTWNTYKKDGVTIRFPIGWYFNDLEGQGVGGVAKGALPVFSVSNSLQNIEGYGYVWHDSDYADITVIIYDSRSVNKTKEQLASEIVLGTRMSLGRHVVSIGGLNGFVDVSKNSAPSDSLKKLDIYWFGKGDSIFEVIESISVDVPWYKSLYYNIIAHSIVQSLRFK